MSLIQRISIALLIIAFLSTTICIADDEEMGIATSIPTQEDLQSIPRFVPFLRPPYPNVINPLLQTFDPESITIPNNFNYDVASVIVDENAQLSFSLNPDLIESTQPLYLNSRKDFEFDQGSREDWLVFYVIRGLISINLSSSLQLVYDVFDQQGNMLPLLSDGRLDASQLQSGFYYLRVLNVGGLGQDPSYSASVGVDLSLAQGGVIGGTVKDQCNDQPISGASVSVATDFRITFKDGSYQFLPKNPGQHTVVAFAEGYQSEQSLANVINFGSTQSDFDLIPDNGCEETGIETIGPPSVEGYTPVTYNDATGVVDINDILVFGPDGEQHYRATLTRIAGSEPLLMELSDLAQISSDSNALNARYEDSQLIIPIMQSAGKSYFLVLIHTPDFKFFISEATLLTP